MTRERTFILIKPDGVARGLVGEVLSTIEQATINIVALNMLHATKETVLAHYTADPVWLENAGRRAIGVLEELGMDTRSVTGVEGPTEIGQLIREQLVAYMCSGPIVAAIIEGNSVINKVRRLVGATLPADADPGSLRGRFCSDDLITSFMEKRALRNIIHASGSRNEAEREIKLWIELS